MTTKISTKFESMWDINVPFTVRWNLYGSLGLLGLPPCPASHGTPDEELSVRVWAALYRERRAAYDAWCMREISLARDAIEQTAALVRGREASVTEAVRGADHVALFGRDGWGHQIEAVLPSVSIRDEDGNYTVDGATVSVAIGEHFGGGNNWFGPPGHRTYWFDFRVEGRTPWVVPPSDAGLDAILKKIDVAQRAAYTRHSSALARVQGKVAEIYSSRVTTHAMSYRAYWRVSRLVDRLYGQVAKMALTLERSPTCPESAAHIDTWPGRSPRPARRLPVLAPVRNGWFNHCALQA